MWDKLGPTKHKSWSETDSVPEPKVSIHATYSTDALKWQLLPSLLQEYGSDGLFTWIRNNTNTAQKTRDPLGLADLQ